MEQRLRAVTKPQSTQHSAEVSVRGDSEDLDQRHRSPASVQVCREQKSRLSVTTQSLPLTALTLTCTGKQCHVTHTVRSAAGKVAVGPCNAAL